MASAGFERSRRLRRYHRADECEQPIGQCARLAHLSRGPVGKGGQLFRRSFATRATANDLHVYRHTVERVPDLVPCPTDYLTSCF